MEEWKFRLYTPEQIRDLKKKYSDSFLQAFACILRAIRREDSSAFFDKTEVRKMISLGELQELFGMFPKMKYKGGCFINVPKINLDKTEKDCLYAMIRIFEYHSNLNNTNCVYCDDDFVKGIFYYLGYQVSNDRIIAFCRR